MPIVRDDDERAVVAPEEFFEPVDGIEVQMVRRLVEEERFGVAEERLSQQHAHFLSALQLAHLPLVQRIRDVEPLQQHRGIAVGGVAVLFADDAFEFAEAHAVFIRHLGFLVQRVTLGHRAPETAVAHDHGVEDAVAVERVLILAKHAEFLRARNRAALRIRLARE